MRAVHDRGTTLTPRGQELLRRARLAHELGGRVLEPAEPLPSGSGDAIACDLFRQSVEWALAAHREPSVAAAQGGGPGPSETATKIDSTELWASARPEFLEAASKFGKGADPNLLRSQIEGRTFLDFAELPASEQARLSRSLRRLAEGMATALDTGQNQIDRLWLRRVLRVSGLLVLIGVLMLFVSWTFEWAEAGHDLAAGAEWSASSLYPGEPGCKSPEQECVNSPNYFVHTNEEDMPWLLFDLKTKQKLSGVRIENRLDCCYERAIPLVVEVSDDAKQWRDVARRTTDFSTWKESFDTVEARYVRIRILKRTNLHFSRVRLFP